MTFEEAYQKLREGTATDEEAAFVARELENVRKISAILDDPALSDPGIEQAEVETVRRARRAFNRKTLFRTVGIVLCSLLAIAAIVCAVLFIPSNLSASEKQKISKAEAKQQAIEMMDRVGIPDAANRFDEYPFQYSGGMRQRIVIAIALSCHPEILICDEPTTALDVTIQAQIIKLIRDLQKELGFTTLYITHDLGVVANVADRVGVMYGGQIIEYGTVEEIFFDPRHPYTWALLSSLPQLGVKGEDLFYITGTPPSLFNEIKGDAFAPRNEHALNIDFQEEPPFFKVSNTHYAKTWLLDPRAPKVEMPAELKARIERMKKGAGLE